MNKKHIVACVFGEEASDAYCDYGLDAMRKVLGNGDGRLVVREFGTEAEADAYRRGVEDMDGWLASCFICEEDITAHPRIISKLSK